MTCVERRPSVVLAALFGSLLTTVAAPATAAPATTPTIQPVPTDPAGSSAQRPISDNGDQSEPRHWRPGRSTLPQSSAHSAAAPTIGDADSARLAVSVRDRSGARPSTEHASYALAFDLATGEVAVVPLTDGQGSAQLAPGAYLVQAFVETPERNGQLSLSMPMRARAGRLGPVPLGVDAVHDPRAGWPVFAPATRLVTSPGFLIAHPPPPLPRRPRHRHQRSRRAATGNSAGHDLADGPRAPPHSQHPSRQGHPRRTTSPDLGGGTAGRSEVSTGASLVPF